MAGDWIKFQIDTPDKPEVLAIASRLGIDPDAVVGKLIRVWSWFDKHTVDGNAHSVTFSFLDRLTGVTGFAEQMQFVGWLEQDGSILKMIHFDYHNGKSAKSRALGNVRQKNHRNNNAKSNATIVTKPLPEKRREEKNINTDVTKVTKGTRFNLQSIPEEWILFCKTERSDLNPTIIFEGFKDYWVSVPSTKGVKLDWFATWRNWIRNQKQSDVKKLEKVNFL